MDTAGLRAPPHTQAAAGSGWSALRRASSQTPGKSRETMRSAELEWRVCMQVCCITCLRRKDIAGEWSLDRIGAMDR